MTDIETYKMIRGLRWRQYGEDIQIKNSTLRFILEKHIFKIEFGCANDRHRNI